MHSKSICSLSLAVALMSTAALAQGKTSAFQKAPGEAPRAETTPAPAQLKGACWTNTPNCAGVAYFVNNSGQTGSCTVYFNNGAQGVSNFVLRPGEQHGIQVRTGDTYACVPGSSGVSPTTQRYYIWVS